MSEFESLIDGGSAQSKARVINSEAPSATPEKKESLGRLEAFSDGIFGVAITLLLIDLKTPPEPTWSSLLGALPDMGLYLLSFLYVGIYWTNHHNFVGASTGLSGMILWANNMLLFMISLMPWSTRWLGESDFEKPVPAAIYGVNLLLAAVAFTLLTELLVRRTTQHTGQPPFPNRKRGFLSGVVSCLMYSTGIGISFWQPLGAVAIYLAVALYWMIPVIFNLRWLAGQ